MRHARDEQGLESLHMTYDERLHRLPRVLEWHLLDLIGGDRLRHVRLEGHGKVHQVQVELLDAEGLDRLEAALFNALGPMKVVPQLGRDPNVGAGHARLLERLADLALVAICANTQHGQQQVRERKKGKATHRSTPRQCDDIPHREQP